LKFKLLFGFLGFGASFRNLNNSTVTTAMVDEEDQDMDRSAKSNSDL